MSRTVLHAEYALAGFDDQLEIGDNIVCPAGRKLLEAIALAMHAHGITPIELQTHKFYGWRLLVEYQQAQFEVVLQHADRWILTATDQARWLTRHSPTHRRKVDAFKNTVMRTLDNLRSTQSS